MKIYSILLVVIQGTLVMSDAPSQKLPELYNLKGYDIPAEFSDIRHKDQIEKDIEEFDKLEPYSPKTYGELDHTSPKLNLEITRQILSRAKDNQHKDFFKVGDDVLNSQAYKKGTKINYNEFYNNVTKKYEKKFPSTQIKQALQNLYSNHFDKTQEDDKKRLSFVQSESKSYIKRPNYLPKDAKTQFLEIKESSKIAFLEYNWEYLNSYNCWASSRWEFAFLFICWNWVWTTIYILWIFPFSYLRPYANICVWIWFLSYPCATQIGGRGISWFWMSESLTEEAKMQEITFRSEFDVIRRLKLSSFLFMSVPYSIKLEISQDQNTWEAATDWIKTPDSADWFLYWWQIDIYYPPQVYAKSCKIIMKGLRSNWYGNRHGLWAVDYFSQTQTIMVLEKTSVGFPRCFARSEIGYFQTEKPFLLMNCMDAILQNDSREVFFLDGLYVKQWFDGMCLSKGQLKGDGDTEFITSQGCQNSDEFKFVIDRLGKFMSKSDPTKCLGAKDDKKITQVQTYGDVTVSGTISDSRADPFNVIDPNGSGFWAAPLDLKSAYWEIAFDRQYLVEEIAIQFKYIPKKISVNVMTPDGRWVTVLTEEPSGDIILQMTPTQIVGVNLHFLELDPDVETDFNRPAFGIRKITIKRPGIPVSFQTCSYQGKDSKLINRFNIENVDYVDTSFLIPHIAAKQFVHDVYEHTKIIVEQFLINVEKYLIVLRIAENISFNIKQINIQIDIIYKQLAPFKNYVKQEGQTASGSCYACSVETAALNCHYIKRKNPLRQNGFFWVKTKCMPEAQRVYCDFESGDGNFYIYEGNLADKSVKLDANNLDTIRNLCKDKGLQNVEIQSEKQIDEIIDYLNLIGANSKDDFGIPFAYQYDLRILGEKFQSLNSKESPDITTMLKSSMETQTLIDKLQTLGSDMILLMKSEDKLFKGYMKSSKIRGVVCSQNIGEEEEKNSQVKGSCDATIHKLGSPKIGTVMKLGCPADCGKAKGARVYGSNGVYSDQSSICRAAIHAGSIQDIEGGLVEVKIVAGKKKYNGLVANEIETFDAEGSEKDQAFSVANKPVQQDCPNLKKTSKKSFVSFDEIINKVQTKRSQSFIESKENLGIESQLAVKDDEGGAGEPKLTMVEAIGYVNSKLQNKLVYMIKYSSFVKDTEALFEQYELTLSSIYGSSLNPQTQETLLQTTSLRIEATKQMIQQLVQQGQAKLANNLEVYLQRLDDLFFLQRYEPHDEEYQLNWQSSYLKMDASKAENGPSDWLFTKEDVYPHNEAISQKNSITCDEDFDNPQGECTATIQTIKYKKFFDFKLQLDFKVRKQGFFGIIFRQKDQYNYYSVDFQNDNIQFRIMKEGKQRIISSGKIDKILSDQWYNVVLVAKETIFTVSIGKETDNANPNKYDMVKQVLKGEDAYFKSGYQSLFTDGTLGFLVDNYSVDHINCWKDGFDEKKAIHHRQPQSSRFIELYLSSFEQVWRQHIKEDILWEYMPNSFGKKKAIRKIMKKTEKSKYPLVLIEKEFNFGWFGFEMYLEQKTTQLSFLFHYQNDKNYNELVISHGKIFLFEVVNGQKNALKVEENKKIIYKRWFQIYIEITQTSIDIFYEPVVKKNRQRFALFSKDLDKPSQKGFGVGFNINFGGGAINNIQLYPGKAPQLEKPDQEPQDDDDDCEGDDCEQPIPDIPVQPPQPEPKPAPTPEDIVFDYKVCLDNTRNQKERWCSLESGGVLPVQMNCVQNFCVQCCEKQIPPTMTSIIEHCIEQCTPEEPDRNNEYKQCFDPKDPKHTVQSICAVQFPKASQVHDRKQCQVDFCDLCCIMTPLTIDKGMLKAETDDCYKNCHQKYD